MSRLSGPNRVEDVCGVLARSGLSDFQLIDGIAAESADAFVQEMRLFVTEAKLEIDFKPLIPTVRAAWAHARTVTAVPKRGVRTVAGDPNFSVDMSPDFSHRLNMLAASRSNRGDKLGGGLGLVMVSGGRNFSLLPGDSRDRAEQRDNSPDVTLSSTVGGDSQNSEFWDSSPLNKDLKSTQPIGSNQPSLNHAIQKKPGYIRREKFLATVESPRKKRKTPKRPIICRF